MELIIKNLNLRINVKKSTSILNVLQQFKQYQNFNIETPCGGNGTCGKCKIKYLSGEIDYILPIKQNDYILACKAIIKGDACIEISINENELKTEVKQINDIIPTNNVKTGVAIDIGTTTISMSFVDLISKTVLKSISILNPQKQYGADVITRIKNANLGKTEIMHKVVIEAIDSIIKNFLNLYNIDNIFNIVVSGNTLMQHLFLNIIPKKMGEYPFMPEFINLKKINSNDIGLFYNCFVFIMPSISSFVGGDVVSGLYSINILNNDENILFIDIGTNGEMVLKSKQNLYTTSTAAGPAFEGSEIDCGMGGISGAINSVDFIDNNFYCKTILDKDPMGICGSGLIDAIAVFITNNLIDKSGLINNTKYNIENKIYILDDLYISQNDIRQFQLAKSAIYSGICILLKTAKIDFKDINKIYLAGGFGFYLNKTNSKLVGLLPNIFDNNKIEAIGNSSLNGAIKFLLSSKLPFQELNNIISVTKKIDLNLDENFSTLFIDNMYFN